MKKYIGIVLVVLMIIGLTSVVMAAPWVPNVGMSVHSTSGAQLVQPRVVVLKYLAVNPTYNPLISTAPYATIDPGDMGPLPGTTLTHPAVKFRLPPGSVVFAYANCPFNVSVSSMTPLRRPERDYAGAVASPLRSDYLWTQINHLVQVNLFRGSWDFQQGNLIFQGQPDYLGGWTGGWISTSMNFTTPHNGLIIGQVKIFAAANPPSFAGPITKHFQYSQDAGLYKTAYTATYSVL